MGTSPVPIFEGLLLAVGSESIASRESPSFVCAGAEHEEGKAPQAAVWPVQRLLCAKLRGDGTVEPIAVEGGKCTVELRGDGVIHLVWKPKVRIEAADAHAAMAAVNEVGKGSEYPMLVDMARTESVHRDARAVFSIPCAASRIALLGSSPVDRVLANFFLGVHIPPCPTRFFTSRSEAMSWLLPEPTPRL
jgi:hypothetical protein